MRLWDVILQVPLLLETSVAKVALQILGVNVFPSIKILHTWNGRSPVWLNMCTLNVVYRPNCFPHSLHGKFFSPRCITLICKSMALFDPYVLPQVPQTKSLMPACDLRCLFRAPGSRNFWPQSSQGLFCSSICLFSSSVRVPSLILCRKTCRLRPSFWMNPSPHLSHLKMHN